MNINIICVGKIKEAFYRDAVAEYIKRLSRYVKTNIIEVADEKTPEKASENEENQIKEKEAERILSKVSKDDYVILLDIGGKKTDSIGFSEFISELALHGKSSISFIIGGSLGVSNNVRARADYRISFSDMTFPHQLMRVILVEQVYRAYRIMNNEPYHK